MYPQIRPTWAEINLDNIIHNVKTIKKCLRPDCEIMAVVKANAYGHGAVEVARAALEAGATRLAVSILDEAVELRRAGIRAPVLVMGYTPAAQGGMAADMNISLTVYEPQQALALVQAARASGSALKVHLKVDTGMGRIGALPDDVLALATLLQNLEGCELEGIYTHFAKADEDDPNPTLLQLERFQAVLERLEQAGIFIPLAHCANSAAIMRFPASHLTAVRLGIAMYGFYPSTLLRQQDVELRPAMTLKTTVAHAKWVPANTPVSYGGRFVTKGPSYIITLPIGYADGLSRSLSNKGLVLVAGQKAPLVGTICMDQCMADATQLPTVKVGDEVILWGEGQGQSLSAEDVAANTGTIVYEVISLVSRRVPRLYLRHGEVVGLRTLSQEPKKPIAETFTESV
ncbi:MAG TPA: alanine racemase [Firmicutes bacterium]|jgi:alanine racemase|nr:alanine racemase [Bacillota bacterium]